MIQNMAKYIDADNDYLIINAKGKIVENLLQKLNLTLEQTADIAGVSVEFVKNIQQRLAANR
ncbi:hypothetical protein WBJ53_26700 [Spirosoma sp. SC4-14]|uniref:hypothetical protein n=1 Tax=Spirosoma sp. SC4-14 TaxID=3128900 RepID=UPI0030D2737C